MSAWFARVFGVMACIFSLGGAYAQEPEPSLDQRIEGLERQVEALTDELERQSLGHVLDGVGESVAGMGPAASKVYRVGREVSIGGYGEALYQEVEGGAAQADFLRAVLYFGYKYSDKWVFNSEIEFEHASTDQEGSTSVEFAYIEYLAHERLNVRAGLLLIPMGIVNEVHEPTTFLPVNRSQTESRIIPSTWRENGIGLYGDLSEAWSYKAYLVNGLRGAGFSEAGLRGGRQKGSKALAEDLAGVVRLDYSPLEGVMLGLSGYIGGSGQDLDVDAMTSIGDLHADVAWNGWKLRAVAAYVDQDDAAGLSSLSAAGDDDVPANGVAENLWGWYVEAGYDVLSFGDTGQASLSPFLRYEQIDTQDRIPAGFVRDAAQAQDILTLGVAYKPIDEIVFKADYEIVENDAGTGRNRLNLGLGYMF